MRCLPEARVEDVGRLRARLQWGRPAHHLAAGARRLEAKARRAGVPSRMRACGRTADPHLSPFAGRGNAAYRAVRACRRGGETREPTRLPAAARCSCAGWGAQSSRRDRLASRSSPRGAAARMLFWRRGSSAPVSTHRPIYATIMPGRIVQCPTIARRRLSHFRRAKIGVSWRAVGRSSRACYAAACTTSSTARIRACIVAHARETEETRSMSELPHPPAPLRLPFATPAGRDDGRAPLTLRTVVAMIESVPLAPRR
jgi:hypothetical protein